MDERSERLLGVKGGFIAECQPEPVEGPTPIPAWLSSYSVPEQLGESSLAGLKRLTRLMREKNDEINDLGVALLSKAAMSRFFDSIDGGEKTRAVEAIERFERVIEKLRPRRDSNPQPIA